MEINLTHGDKDEIYLTFSTMGLVVEIPLSSSDIERIEELIEFTRKNFQNKENIQKGVEEINANGKTVHETHEYWVQKLKDRGEAVLQPKRSEPLGNVRGYIKTEIPHVNAGAIFKDKDGTFGLFGDMGATHIVGIEWKDLGLCDGRCWYEWMDENKGEGE